MLLFHGSPGTLGKRVSIRRCARLGKPRQAIQRAFIEDKASGGHGGGAPQASAVPPSLVRINFQDLAAETDLRADIEKAYGPNGLGILVIANVPDYVQKRQRLLPLAAEFASLPDEIKDKYTDAASHYSFGWSHGKESMSSGVADTFKGSFYANPLVDDQLSTARNGDSLYSLQPWFRSDNTRQTRGAAAPNGSVVPSGPASAAAATGNGSGSNDRADAEVVELRRRHPSYLRRNLWPWEELPELEVAFKELGQLVCAVGCLLTEHCDRYVSSQLATPPGHLSGVLHRSRNPKARLLHYFPPPPDAADAGAAAEVEMASSGGRAANEPEQAWCGLHTDHGSLTGLTSAMYLDAEGREVPSPDPEAGLFIQDRNGAFIRAAIPPDCIAFQVGEALQVQSAGRLMATPHYVRAPRPHLARGISRNTFAVFMQPDVFEPLNCPEGVEQQRVAVGQWRPGTTFGEFAEATFVKYYQAAGPP